MIQFESPEDGVSFFAKCILRVVTCSLWTVYNMSFV
jgi:hypothetical protein